MSEPLPFDPIAQARRQWSERWGEKPARSMAAVTSLMRAQQILLARLGELLRPFGLTFPRYETLMVLVFSRTGALPVGKMGERLQVHRTSMTHMADRLEEAGLVTRVAHSEDRRSTLIAITPAGRDLALRATAVLNEAGFAMDPLDEEQLDTLTNVLEGIRWHEGDFVKPGEPLRAPRGGDGASGGEDGRRAAEGDGSDGRSAGDGSLAAPGGSDGDAVGGHDGGRGRALSASRSRARHVRGPSSAAARAG